MNIPEQKTHLRKSIGEQLLRVPERKRSAESRSLCGRLAASLPEHPGTIAAYFPLSNEADIRPLLLTLLERGATLVLPCFEGGRIIFRETKDLLQLRPGPFGIPEPPKDSPTADPKDLAIALVPGRAFDARGWRLGRGNGGYDRWICTQRTLNPKTQFWGIAFECQLVQEVPHEEHDEKVDAIVTTRGMVVSYEHAEL